MHTTWEMASWCALAGFAGYAVGRAWFELELLWKAFFAHGVAQRRGSQAFCPGCHKDLVSSTSSYWDDGHVYYICSECGVQSRWDFDAPVPILLASNKRS